MSVTFAILALLAVSSAAAAMALRNVVHCALSLVVTFAALAGLFLQLNAEFAGLAQILVYIGAVAILIVFAILLTRGNEPVRSEPIATSAAWGLAIALAAFLVMAAAVWSSAVIRRATPPEPELTVRAIGDKLMQDYVLPLEVIGLLLTAALVGAVIIALQEKGEKK